jgi:hypothetical protein
MARANSGITSLAQVKNDLVCHSCQKIPRSGPIYKSSKTLCCQDCIKTCDHTKIRDTLAETLILSLPFVCHQHVNGCTVEIAQIEIMKEHEEDCRFRMIQCPQSYCGLVIVRDMVDHVKSAHPNVENVVPKLPGGVFDCSMNITGGDVNKMFHFETHNEHFYLKIRYHARS